MSTLRTRRPGWRATITVVALYALVLSSLLGGLAGATALAAPGHDPAFAICHADPADPGAPVPGDALVDCRTICRLAGATAPVLTPPAAGIPRRRPPLLALADRPDRTSAPVVRRTAGPLGSRAPPAALSRPSHT